MMKHLSIVFGLVLLGLISNGIVLADTTPGAGQTGDGVGQQQNLDAIKQRVEQRIQDAISKMRAKLVCVQAAQDPQSLRSCFPNRGQHRHGGYRMGRPGGQG